MVGMVGSQPSVVTNYRGKLPFSPENASGGIDDEGASAHRLYRTSTLELTRLFAA